MNRIDFKAMPQTAIKVVTSPDAFFRTMPKSGGFIEPLLFSALMGAAGGFIAAVASLLGLSIGGESAGQGLALIIIVPLFTAIGGFVAAGILFVIWKLMGSLENYEVAFRCNAYLCALIPIMFLLGLIPYAGGVANMGLLVYYTVIASIETHGLESKKAWMVFGILGLVLALFGVKGEYTARKNAGLAEKYLKQSEEMSEAMKQQAEAWKKAAEGMRK